MTKVSIKRGHVRIERDSRKHVNHYRRISAASLTRLQRWALEMLNDGLEIEASVRGKEYRGGVYRI